MFGAAENNEEIYSTASNDEDSAESGEEDSSSGRGESEEIDPEEEYKLRLIKEVEKRQVLWDTRRYIVDRRNRENRRVELWEEVAAALCGKNWSEVTERKAQLKVERAQKKWKNMKDCYFRYVKRRQGGEKVRRYRYFEQLKFLKPIVLYKITAQKRKTCCDSAKQSTPDGRGSKRPSKRPRKEPASSNQASSGAASRTRDDASSSRPGSDPASDRTATSSVVRCDGPQPGGSAGAVPPADSTRPMAMPCEAVLLELLRTRRADLEPDEDRDFASSLVPMLKRLDDDKKHYAKTHILHVMKTARYWVPDAEVDLLPGSVLQADLPLPFPSSTSASHKGDEDSENMYI